MDDNLDKRIEQFKAESRAEAERLHPGGKFVKVKASEIQTGPIRHESLPEDLLPTIKQLFDDVGRHVSPTLEQWEVGFMRDMHPDREIAVWCRIAVAWRDFHKRHAHGKRLADKDEEKLVGALCSISSGTTEVAELKLPERTGRRLLDCYLSVGVSDPDAPTAP